MGGEGHFLILFLSRTSQSNFDEISNSLETESGEKESTSCK